MKENTNGEYFFYGALDKTKERISKINAKSLEEAIAFFATLKGLKLNEFKKIYNVEHSKQPA